MKKYFWCLMAAATVAMFGCKPQNEATNPGGEEDEPGEEAIIQIDGNFADWDNADLAADMTIVTSPENNKYEALKTAKFITDENYLYFYLEFDASTYTTGEGTEGYTVDPIDFYFATDGNADTGSDSYLWEDASAEFLIEGFWSNNYSDAGIYTFPADADPAEWAWADAGIVGSTTTSDRVIIKDGVAAIEGSVILAMLPGTIAELKVGVFCSNTDWAESGSLPATLLNEDGTTTALPMANVKLH